MAQKGLRYNKGSTSEQKEFKVIAVGDTACGKTALITTYTTGVFPEIYDPTVFDTAVANTVFEGQQFQLNIYDCGGTEDFDRLRSVYYRNVDVVLMCYDVMNPSSFDNIFEKWYPEVKHFCDGVPIVLVGCKTDLRSDKFLEEGLWSLGQKPIKYTQGEEAARKISAAAYVECSAKCNKNVENVFREATKQALMGKRVKDRCTLL